MFGIMNLLSLEAKYKKKTWHGSFEGVLKCDIIVLDSWLNLILWFEYHWQLMWNFVEKYFYSHYEMFKMFWAEFFIYKDVSVHYLDGMIISRKR